MTETTDLALVFERAPIPIVVIDLADRNIARANAAWRELTRCPEPFGRSVHELAAELVTQLPGMVVGDPPSVVDDVCLGDAWYRVTLEAVRTDAGRTLVIAAYAERTREVHDRGLALEAAAHKDRFIVDATHELRTPLAALGMWLHILVDTSFDEAQRGKAVLAIQRSASELSHIMANLIDLSRTISGELRIDLEKVDIDTLLARVAGEREPGSLVLSVDPGLGPITGNEGRLRTIINDLFVELAGSRTSMGARREGETIVIDISGTRMQSPGRLGHALHERLLALMGGRFTETTKPDTGTTFTLTVRRSPVDRE